MSLGPGVNFEWNKTSELTPSHLRPYRFVQLISNVKIRIIKFLYPSKDLVYTGILARLEERKIGFINTIIFPLAEIINNFSFTIYSKFK